MWVRVCSSNMRNPSVLPRRCTNKHFELRRYKLALLEHWCHMTMLWPGTSGTNTQVQRVVLAGQQRDQLISLELDTLDDPWLADATEPGWGSPQPLLDTTADGMHGRQLVYHADSCQDHLNEVVAKTFLLTRNFWINKGNNHLRCCLDTDHIECYNDYVNLKIFNRMQGNGWFTG